MNANTELNYAKLNPDRIVELQTELQSLLTGLSRYTEEQLNTILLNLNSSFKMTKDERKTFTKKDYQKVILQEVFKLGCEDDKEANEWIDGIVKGESWILERGEAIKLNTNFVETPEAKKETEPVKLKSFIVNYPDAKPNEPIPTFKTMNATNNALISQRTLSCDISTLCMLCNLFYNDHTTHYLEMFLDAYDPETKPLALRLKQFENEHDFLTDSTKYLFVYQSCLHTLMYLVFYGDYERRMAHIVKDYTDYMETRTLPREHYDIAHENLHKCCALLDSLASDLSNSLKLLGYAPKQMKSGATLTKADFAWFSRRNGDKKFVSFKAGYTNIKELVMPDGSKGLCFDFEYGYTRREVAGAELTETCCICRETYRGFGNNAQPYRDGRCCDDCNTRYVLKARMADFELDHNPVGAIFKQAENIARVVEGFKSVKAPKRKPSVPQPVVETEEQIAQRLKAEAEVLTLVPEVKEKKLTTKELRKQEEKKAQAEAKAEQKLKQKQKDDYLKSIGQYLSPEDLKKQREKRLKAEVAQMTQKRR